MTRRAWGVLLLVLAALAVASWKAVLADRLATMREINVFISRENAKLEKETEEVRSLPEEIAAVLERKAVRERAIGDSMLAAEALSELSRLPRGIVVQRAVVKDRRLTVDGEAASEADLARVLPALAGARYAGGFKLEPVGEGASPAPRRFRLVGEVALPGRVFPRGQGS